jgi:hypothetical protein
MSVEEKRSTPAAFIRYVRQIRSQIIATGALILALVSQADATAEHDYKPGEFLIVDGGTLARNPSGRSRNAIRPRRSVNTERSRNQSMRGRNRPISISFGLMLKVNASFYPATRLAF